LLYTVERYIYVWWYKWRVARGRSRFRTSVFARVPPRSLTLGTSSHR